VSDWNSTLYLKFERERTRAACDLLAQLPDFEPRNVFDLGCGPGNSTELLATAFPRATIVGIDSSDQMLAVAKCRLESAEFIKQGIESWRPTESADLIFANAALQFVPNHHELMPHLVSFLSEGGWLAVQMPDNIHELSHALMRMVAADGPWANRLVPIAKTRALIGPLDEYCIGVDLSPSTVLAASRAAAASCGARSGVATSLFALLASAAFAAAPARGVSRSASRSTRSRMFAR
jgi:trans-aconitate 2-methyltransferase